MNLQQPKENLNKAGFSEGSLQTMNQILDEAIRRGSLTSDEKTKLLGIIDFEIESASVEAGAMEEVAMALDSFADEVGRANGKFVGDIEQADKDLAFDIDTATKTSQEPSISVRE